MLLESSLFNPFDFDLISHLLKAKGPFDLILSQLEVKEVVDIHPSQFLFRGRPLALGSVVLFSVVLWTFAGPELPVTCPYS